MGMDTGHSFPRTSQNVKLTIHIQNAYNFTSTLPFTYQCGA